MARDEETTPLLADQRHAETNGNGYGAASEPVADVEAAIDGIKKALPKSMVIPSFIAALSALLICAIDSTFAMALAGPISSSFSASDRAFWINAAYLLAMSLAPVFGRLGEITSRKFVFLLSVSVFGVGTLLCAMSQSMNMFIISRAIQGVGAAGIQPSVAINTSDLIPLRQRGLYQAVGQLVFSFGFSMGGSVGGLLYSYFGWRRAFSIQLIPISMAIILLAVFLRLPTFPKTADEQKRLQVFEGMPLSRILWLRLDPIGAILFVISIISMLLSLSLLSAYDLNLDDLRFWGGMLTSLVLMIAFVIYEIKFAYEPLLPMRFLKNKNLWSIWAIYALMSACVSLLFFIPWYDQVILDQTPKEVGLTFIPVGLATLSGSFTSGGLLRKFGRYRRMAFILGGLFVSSTLLLCTWTATNQPSKFVQYTILIPHAYGGAGLNTVLLVITTAFVGQQDVAACITLLYVFRTIGSCAGLSIFGTVIQKIVGSELSRSITGKHAKERINVIRKSIEAIATLPKQDRKAAVAAYGKALHVFFISTAVLSVISWLLIPCIEERSLDKTSANSDDDNDGVAEEQT